METYLIEYDQQPSAGRDALREDHIAHRRSVGKELLLAGPILGDEGDSRGSIVLIAANGRDSALNFAEGDPYVSAGVLRLKSVRRVRVATWNPTLNTP